MAWAKERHFELMLVINPEYSEQVANIIDVFRKAIKEHGGRLTREEDWGRRPFAYRIDKYSKGFYVLLNFACASRAAVDAIGDNLENNDSVLRSLLSRTTDEVAQPSPVALAEQARAEEQAAA